MTRIKVIVEGATEESFIKDVLAPIFHPQSIYVTPILLGVPGHKGGHVNWARAKKDILLQLKQDRRAYCTTMFDFYGLGSGFPGPPPIEKQGSLDRAKGIEQSALQQIAEQAPDLDVERRFAFYLQLHEYEGLLFSDPDALAIALGQEGNAERLKRIRNDFPTPEDINDSTSTAPSKRISALYPAYRKVIDGTLAAQRVGLPAMLRECPHFREWVHWLSTRQPIQ